MENFTFVRVRMTACLKSNRSRTLNKKTGVFAERNNLDC